MTAPWMPFYVADYLGDTSHLKTVEHGAYLLLIMHYWRAGKLPTDEGQLATICRMNAREWQKHRGVISDLFDDQWRHQRIENEIAKSVLKSNARASSGSRGGIAKSLKNNNADLANATVLPEQKDGFAVASSSQSQSQLKEREEVGSPCSPTVGSQPLASDQESLPLENPLPKSRKAYSVDFESLWSEWPQNPNESKKTANDRWLKLTADERHDCFDGALAQGLWLEAEKTKRKGQDPPRIHLSTFISERRWETLLKTEFNKYGRTPWQAHHQH